MTNSGFRTDLRHVDVDIQTSASADVCEMGHWQTVPLWQWCTVLTVRLITSPARMLCWIMGNQ